MSLQHEVVMFACICIFVYVFVCVGRPHNSGHYTIEACDIDQFEMHLRAVLGTYI